MAKRIRIIPEIDERRLRQQLNNISKRREKIRVDLDSSNINNANKNMKQLNNTVTQSDTLFGRLKNTIGNTFSANRITMTGFLTLLHSINTAGKNAKKTIQEIDSAITDLSIATNESRQSMAGLVKDYNEYAQLLSSTTTQVTNSADAYLRAGKSMSEARALIQDSVMLSKLGQIDSAEATEDLLATMNGYDMSIEEVNRALDAMVAIDMVAATSAGDIATALKYSASSAEMAGVSFNKLAAMIGTVQDKTQQSAETIGTFMNTLLSRYRNVKIGQFVSDDGDDLSEVETVLKSLNISLRESNQEFRSFESIIDEVALSWNNYSSVQQAAIAKAFAGTRQQNRFIALIDGYNKTLELTEVAANSAGTAVEKFNNSYKESLEAKQNTLQASFESMVMNSDFSKTYLGIIEATTALVDFINQTNALKGAMAGLSVGVGVKAFLAIRTVINESYISLNKFGNALNIVKQTKISTGDFNRLLLLSNGLSTSQMKLVLSTNKLSVARKRQLLMASGLTKQEANLKLQTWGMTKAQTGLTIATTNVSNAFKGLIASIKAHPLMMATMVISGVTMAYQTYKQKLEEARQKSIEVSESAIEQANSLRELYTEYTRLSSIQNRTNEEEEQFKSVIEDVTKALGDKAQSLEGLTVGTKEYAEALANVTKEELRSASVKATVGRKSVEEDIKASKIWSDWSGSTVHIDSNDKGKRLSENAQRAVDIVSDALKDYETVNQTWRNVSWDISNDNPEELYEYYSALIRAREELVVASKSNEELLNTEIYDDLNSAINTMSDSMDSYISKRYEEEKLTYMAQRGIPQTTEAYRIMESTLLGGLSAYDDMQKKFKELLSVDFSELINDTETVVDNVANEDIKDAPLLNLSTQLTNSKEALETFTSSVHSAFDAYSTLMNPNVSSADMLSSITQLSELAKTMGKDLNWEMLYGFGDTVTQLGSSIEYISEEYAKSVLSGAGIDSKFVDMLAHSIVQAKQAETQLSRLDSQIDSLQSSYTDLTDIIETYNSNGYITFDQLQKLLALEPQYLACLVDENGQLSLNNESMRLLAEQRLNEAKAQIIQQAITELSELVTHKETTALADNITTRQEQLGKLSEYNTKMADAIAKTTIETELVRELNAELGNASANGASDEDINNVLNNAYKKLKLVDDIGAKTTTNLGGIMGGSSSSSAKDTIKTFDWIETLISRIQRNITNLGKLVSATYRNWSTRNNALAQEMAEVNKEINAQMTAYNAYMEKANSIPLAEGYKALVRSGAYDISTITDEKLQEQISEYEEWYNKALDASDAIEDLRANLAELAMTKFNNVSEQYDEQISLITHNVSMLEGFVSQSEVAGYMASEVYYKAMAEKQQENIAQLQGEYSSLLSAFDEAVKSGSIEKYSSDWYEMLSAINDVELELQDATTQLIEFNQTLQQLSWEVFDRVRESVNDITTEAEFLIDILDSKDLHTDKGVITDEGLAVQGLHAVNYNTYMEQALAYVEEMRKIEAEMAKDPYDMELVDRRNELLELQQEAIQNSIQEKESIVDLYKNGYDKMLDSLDKLIQKRKSALQLTKDMYDYEKNISEQTSNIASLRKQLQAYATDNSESAKSTIQKLQVSLTEAESSLRETELEKYIDEQQKLLDSLVDDTEAWITQRLDDTDRLVAEAVDATNKNAETISSTIKETANSYGYGISDQMETIWDSANDVVCTYGDILKGTNENIANNITTGTTNVVNAINGLNGSMQTMIGKLNEIATANANSIAQAQNAVVNGQNSSYGGNNSTSDYTVSGGNTKDEPTKKQTTTTTSNTKYAVIDRIHKVAIKRNLGLEDARKFASLSGNYQVVEDKNFDSQGRYLKKYASGTTNATKGFNLVSDGNGDEIILTNDGNAVLAKGMQLFPFEGGETVFDATKTAELLKGSLVPLSADQLWGNIIKTPKLPEMSKGVGGNVTNNNQFSFELPNVVDANSLITELQHNKRFEKIIDSMTAGRMTGKGSFDKFRF